MIIYSLSIYNYSKLRKALYSEGIYKIEADHKKITWTNINENYEVEYELFVFNKTLFPSNE